MTKRTYGRPHRLISGFPATALTEAEPITNGTILKTGKIIGTLTSRKLNTNKSST